MSTHFTRYTAAVILVLVVAIGVFLLGSPFALTDPGIPDTVLANPKTNSLENTLAKEMDMGQLDEKAKLEPYPIILPPLTGELDWGQIDEKAKLEPYPIILPPLTGELDWGQIDEKSKLETYPE